MVYTVVVLSRIVAEYVAALPTIMITDFACFMKFKLLPVPEGGLLLPVIVPLAGSQLSHLVP